MKKLLIMICAAVMVTGCTSAGKKEPRKAEEILTPVRTAQKDAEITIPYLRRPVRVDGVLSDWKNIASMPLPYMKKETSSLRLGWRKDGLYGALLAKDRTLREIDEDAPWKGDCLELFIERDNRLAPYELYNYKVEQYVFCYDAKLKPGPGSWMIGYGAHRCDMWEKREKITPRCYWKKRSSGYSLEFYIPSSYLEPALMKDGSKITLHFALTNDGKVVEQFATDKNSNHGYRTPKLWRTVVFRK